MMWSCFNATSVLEIYKYVPVGDEILVVIGLLEVKTDSSACALGEVVDLETPI